jgi:probable HAF family extracellular repeat protein
MRRLFSLLVTVATLLLVSAPLAPAQGTYAQIDVPGATYTAGVGVDTAGDIVGVYGGTSGNQDGFLFSGGTYTTIAYPGSPITRLFGINDLGEIVGDASIPNTGFLYDLQSQTFTTINRPGASFTYPFAINNTGAVAGQLGKGASFLGFELVGSQYKIISPPRTSTSYVFGITASGALFGVAGTKNATFNFSFSQGKYSQFSIPNAPGAIVNGVNPAGTALVGYYNPSSGVTAGFIYQNKAITTLQFPGSNFTQAYGINAAGEVVGVFVDAEDGYHGFTWTPPAPAEKK